MDFTRKDVIGRMWSLLSFCSPETLHRWAITGLDLGVSLPFKEYEDDPALSTRALGQRFSNPLGVAAGFDKDGRVIRPLLRLGFGYVEAGSVTLRPQYGNPKPRLFRLDKDRAIINRMGLNSSGVKVVRDNLVRYRRQFEKDDEAFHPLGINLALNKQSSQPVLDYLQLFESVSDFAGYITLNISCPNVGYAPLAEKLVLLKEVMTRIGEVSPRHPPILLKISPDLDGAQLQEIVKVARDTKIHGFIISNTTLSRPTTLHGPHREEKGGLSGEPLAALSLKMLKQIRLMVGDEMTLISCGGITTGADVVKRIACGAHLVQILTSFIYRGPYCAFRIKDEIRRIMRAKGIETLDDIRGSALCAK